MKNMNYYSFQNTLQISEFDFILIDRRAKKKTWLIDCNLKKKE